MPEPTLLEQISNIFKNPVSQWNTEDYRLIDRGNKELGRQKMQEMLDKAGTEGK